jgi:hypothetical protein
MKDILFHYNPVNPTTWVYLSSLLMVALFFKFGRLWSLRNLDLFGLMIIAPGLLLAEHGGDLLAAKSTADAAWVEHLGYTWLFAAGAVFLLRLLIDSVMVRRPLLEPNLSVGGMTFLGVSLFVFLTANVLNGAVDSSAVEAAVVGDERFQPPDETTPDDEVDQEAAKVKDRVVRFGPAYPLWSAIPRIVTQGSLFQIDDDATGVGEPEEENLRVNEATIRLTAILSHFAVVVGMIVIGYRHFDNYRTGVAAATLYLMLPYTAQKTGDIYHVLPAALLVWLLASYRRPLIAGLLMGSAIGTIYYPIFLLPLWIAFYWRRGLIRFGVGTTVTLALLAANLAIWDYQEGQLHEFPGQIQQMFGWAIPATDNLEGFWNPAFTEPSYRFPVLAAFVALCGSFALWPAQKNLGALISCTAAVMLGTQFWHAHGGGLFMAWYMPILLLTIFRPNLEDRVALSVLGEGWRPKWANRKRAETQAA